METIIIATILAAVAVASPSHANDKRSVQLNGHSYGVYQYSLPGYNHAVSHTSYGYATLPYSLRHHVLKRSPGITKSFADSPPVYNQWAISDEPSTEGTQNIHKLSKRSQFTYTHVLPDDGLVPAGHVLHGPIPQQVAAVHDTISPHGIAATHYGVSVHQDHSHVRGHQGIAYHHQTPAHIGALHQGIAVHQNPLLIGTHSGIGLEHRPIAVVSSKGHKAVPLEHILYKRSAVQHQSKRSLLPYHPALPSYGYGHTLHSYIGLDNIGLHHGAGVHHGAYHPILKRSIPSYAHSHPALVYGHPVHGTSHGIHGLNHGIHGFSHGVHPLDHGVHGPTHGVIAEHGIEGHLLNGHPLVIEGHSHHHGLVGHNHGQQTYIHVIDPRH